LAVADPDLMKAFSPEFRSASLISVKIVDFPAAYAAKRDFDPDQGRLRGIP